MTVSQLIVALGEGLAAGDFAPDTVVVRPFCQCDEAGGWVEAEFLDPCQRPTIPAPHSDVRHFGRARPDGAVRTLKLC